VRAGIFGRDAELRAIDSFLADVPLAARALVLTGEAGAGKTTLLRAATARAADQGFTVLAAMPSASELRLAFAGLADLLNTRLDDVLAGLPPPQRRALAVAMLVEDAPDHPPDPHLIAAAFRTALSLMARSAPVLVVVDDVQWLDQPTELAIGFAFRRMAAEPVGVICARRGLGSGLPLELGRSQLAVETLPLGGLSLGALHHLLKLRLGTSFSHPTLRAIESGSGGNPFIALEIGRALSRRGVGLTADNALPVPDSLADLVSERLLQLPSAVADALGLVAVMPGAAIGRYLAAGLADRDLDAALVAGVLESDSGSLRFSHPLLAASVLGSIPPARRRDLHAAAARCAAAPEERVRHRALAATGRSAAIAAELDDAARAAVARGAPATAADLIELAASLTPEDDPAAERRRRLDAARQLARSGQTRAARASLERLSATMPRGSDRAEALSQLGWLHADDFVAATGLLERALTEMGDDPVLAADIRISLSDIWSNRGDQARAVTEARMAMAEAERSGDPALIASALTLVFDSSWMSGAQVDEALLARALELEPNLHSSGLRYSPSRSVGIYCYLRGDLDGAEAAMQRVLERAEADGIEEWRADMLLRLSQVARRRGDAARALDLASSALDIAEQLDLPRPTCSALYSRAAAALQLGQAETVRELAGRGLELARQTSDTPLAVCYQALLGSLDLALGDYLAAAARFRPLTARLLEIGWQPTTQSIAPDAAEALIAAGELDQAGAFLTELERGMTDPVSRALAARCRGLLAAARGQLDVAVSALGAARRLHDEVCPQPLEIGRTLLVLGAVQRRVKQRRLARETLTQAIAILDGIGATLWAARARAELARVSGRAPGSGELTATELRVAELVAAGLTNSETASQLFVTVRAVESTLTKVYAKLGLRSRTELAEQLLRQR
jgi:DNA-binding CsgD family transcriptional regulator